MGRHDGVCAFVVVQDTRVSSLEQHATHILGSVEALHAFQEGNTPAKSLFLQHFITDLMGTRNEPRQDSYWVEASEAPMDRQEDALEEPQGTLTAIQDMTTSSPDSDIQAANAIATTSRS